MSFADRPSRLLCAALIVGAAALTGCAQIKMGAPAPSIDNIQMAKASGMAPASLGEFAPAPGKPARFDAGLDVRSNTLSSPIDGSFAKYLKETLATELMAAGLLDAASTLVIQGQLTQSELAVPTSQASGTLGARFVVVRAGRTVYDKELKVAATWESSFVGAVAIPAAVNEYTSLYRKLVGQLLGDPDFRRAVSG